MGAQLDIEALIQEYTPLLVLSPEIPAGSVRKINKDYPHVAPLDFDYHPRDIKLVLGKSAIGRVRGGGANDWERVLNKMEDGGYKKNLDLLKGVKPHDKARFWTEYAAIPKDNPNHARTCYARMVEGSGILQDRFLVQYWYPYFYNDFWNTHEMDWETVMIIFAKDAAGPRPTVCAYSAHIGGHWLGWDNVDKADQSLGVAADGTHPVVYVANGSHANYFYEAGLFPTAPPLVAMATDLLKKPGKLIDYTMSWDDGDRHLVEAKIIPSDRADWSGDWRWLNQEGLWGSKGKWFDFEFGDSAPNGPPQAGSRWETPFNWIDTNCTRAPSMVESRVPSRI